MTPPIIVLTGGPCAGKTSIMEELYEEFHRVAVFVPEAATQLFALDYPRPADGWSPADWRQLQCLIVKQQLHNESTAQVIASRKGAGVIVCDRGLADCAAYPGGKAALQGLDSFGRYNSVIHLESLATAQPELYSAAANHHRYEDLDGAVKAEHNTRRAWRTHPGWQFVGGADLEFKATQAMNAIGLLLESAYDL